MFTKIKSLFAPKVYVPVQKNWRIGMWVMYDGEAHILYKLDPVTIHSVNKETGETTGEKQVPLESLSQAHYDEIPECRRKITREQAKELGYAT